jgi:hypothetical protein
LPPSFDRDLVGGSELVEVADACDELQAPVARGGERGGADDVVAGTGLGGLELDRLDSLAGQRGLEAELLRGVVLAPSERSKR